MIRLHQALLVNLGQLLGFASRIAGGPEMTPLWYIAFSVPLKKQAQNGDLVHAGTELLDLWSKCCLICTSKFTSLAPFWSHASAQWPTGPMGSDTVECSQTRTVHAPPNMSKIVQTTFSRWMFSRSKGEKCLREYAKVPISFEQGSLALEPDFRAPFSPANVRLSPILWPREICSTCSLWAWLPLHPLVSPWRPWRPWLARDLWLLPSAT